MKGRLTSAQPGADCELTNAAPRAAAAAYKSVLGVIVMNQ